MWYERIDCYLKFIGMTHSHNDYYLYYIGTGNNKTILIVYVDFLFVTRGDEGQILWLKQKHKHEFDLTNLGLVMKYLRIEFKYTNRGVFLTQHQFATDMLQEFGMENSMTQYVLIRAGLLLVSNMKSTLVDTHHYCREAGKLIFLTTNGLDLAFAFNSVSRFIGNLNIHNSKQSTISFVM